MALIKMMQNSYFAGDKTSGNGKGHYLGHIGSGTIRFQLGAASVNVFHLPDCLA